MPSWVETYRSRTCFMSYSRHMVHKCLYKTLLSLYSHLLYKSVDSGFFGFSFVQSMIWKFLSAQATELHSWPKLNTTQKEITSKNNITDPPPPSPCFCPHSCCHRSYAGSQPRLPSPNFFLYVVLLLPPVLILEGLLQQQHDTPPPSQKKAPGTSGVTAQPLTALPTSIETRLMEEFQEEKKNVTSMKVFYLEKFHFFVDFFFILLFACWLDLCEWGVCVCSAEWWNPVVCVFMPLCRRRR